MLAKGFLGQAVSEWGGSTGQTGIGQRVGWKRKIGSGEQHGAMRQSDGQGGKYKARFRGGLSGGRGRAMRAPTQPTVYPGPGSRPEIGDLGV